MRVSIEVDVGTSIGAAVLVDADGALGHVVGRLRDAPRALPRHPEPTTHALADHECRPAIVPQEGP